MLNGKAKMLSSFQIKEILGWDKGEAFMSAMRSAGYKHEKRLEQVDRYDNVSKLHSSKTTVYVNYYDLDECMEIVNPKSIQVQRIEQLMEHRNE